MTAADDRAPSKTRLILLILEGYVYLAVIAGIPAAATAFIAWGVYARRPFIAVAAILVGVPLALTTARTLRTLFFTFSEPDGIVVEPPFGDRLIEEVDAIRRPLRAPKVHRIIVSDSYDASASQQRRLGFSTRNSILLGYPLLAVVPVETIRAVIAHELAHIALAHGRFSGWVHRTRISWWRIMERLEREGGAPAYAYLLFRFYVPRLQAQAAAVSRRHELLADRVAADLTSPELAAQALVAIEIGGYLLDQTFWPQMFGRVRHEPDPPAPFTEMQPGIWAAMKDRKQLLAQLLARHTSSTDTHPALRDRLAQLGQPPLWPEPAAVSAADYFFGQRKQEVSATLDRTWLAANEQQWREHHARLRQKRDRLAQLTGHQTATAEETYECAVLTEEEGDAQAALHLYRAAQAQGHPGAGLATGRILLERGDEAGIALVEWRWTGTPHLRLKAATRSRSFSSTAVDRLLRIASGFGALGTRRTRR